MDFTHTLMEALEMEVLTTKKDMVEIKMPVNDKTRQPMGFLHGGASVALAESAASIAAYLNVDSDRYHVFGMEINANHIKSKKNGWVTARAEPIHIGQHSMVWSVQIIDEEANLISISRCTIGVVPKKNS